MDLCFVDEEHVHDGIVPDGVTPSLVQITPDRSPLPLRLFAVRPRYEIRRMSFDSASSISGVLVASEIVKHLFCGRGHGPSTRRSMPRL
jgi:hypothetical protein